MSRPSYTRFYHGKRRGFKDGRGLTSHSGRTRHPSGGVGDKKPASDTSDVPLTHVTPTTASAPPYLLSPSPALRPTDRDRRPVVGDRIKNPSFQFACFREPVQQKYIEGAIFMKQHNVSSDCCQETVRTQVRAPQRTRDPG